MTYTKKIKQKRFFNVVNADLPDEILWAEFWLNKTPEEKLNTAEEIIRGGNAAPRLQRIFRVIERVKG